MWRWRVGEKGRYIHGQTEMNENYEVPLQRKAGAVCESIHATWGCSSL